MYYKTMLSILAKSLIISFQYNIESVYFFYSDPKFHHPLIVDGVGKSTRASFAILNKGCLFRVGLFIILRVVVAP